MTTPTTPAPTKYYFGYGMFTVPGSVEQMHPGARRVGVARLDGYRLAFGAHADVEPAPGCSVYGVLWALPSSNVDREATLRRLDGCEGVPHYYTRETAHVTLETHAEREGAPECIGGMYRAAVYEMSERSRASRKGSMRSAPSFGYAGGIVHGLAAAGLSLATAGAQVARALAESGHRWSPGDAYTRLTCCTALSHAEAARAIEGFAEVEAEAGPEPLPAVLPWGPAYAE